MVQGSASGAFLNTCLRDLVAVVVGEMNRTTGRGHIHQRRHRQEDRVDGIAGVPDDRQTGEHAVHARSNHQADEQFAPQ